MKKIELNESEFKDLIEETVKNFLTETRYGNNSFEIQLFRKFPQNETKILTNNGVFSFDDIRFYGNSEKYYLVFEKDDDTNVFPYYIFIELNDNNGIKINRKNIEITDEDSIYLLKEMLKYNN